jgi:uncharacterized protein
MWQRAWYAAGLAAIVGIFTIHGLALGASFDCAHATAPREQLICADPDLSDLDGRLGRAYQQRRAVLSPQGAELLQSSQRSWLRFIATVCPLKAPADADSRQLPKNCLADHYKERLDQIAKVGQRLGPFVFNRIDLFAAKPAQDSYTGFDVQHVAYPQIDNLHSPEVDAWNRQNLKSLSENDYGEDDETDYEIGFANKRMISVGWWSSSMGAAHPTTSVEARNVILLPNLRPLTEHDVFGADDRWVVKLQGLFWDALVKAGWSPPDESAKREIQDDVIRSRYWLFTTEGLNVSFSSYAGACYACTPQPVTVPWAALKPLLSPSAVVP